MKMRLVAAVLAFILSSCGTILRPASPDGRVWGFGYRVQVMPAGSLAPRYAETEGYTVRIEAPYQTRLWTIAHELVHIWQWGMKVYPLSWQGVPCAHQPTGHCSAWESQADAIADAVVAANCTPGDLGWPGQRPSGCRLPHPSEIHPPK